MESGKWALLIGIDQYENATPLRFARADVKDLARVLQETCGFSPDHIKLLVDTAGAREQVTHTGIIGALEDMAAQVQDCDTFLFYFAGHGITRDGQSYLLGVNTDLSSTRKVQMTSVPMAVLHDALAAIPAREKALILDACRNDPSAGRADAPNRLDRQMWDGFRDIVVAAAEARPNLEATAAVLFACDVGERSWEWLEQGHSVFNHYLVESLESGAADVGGDIEFTAVASYVQRKLEEWSRYNRERAQRPIYESKGGARLVLGRRVPRVARLPEGTTALRVEVAFWNSIGTLGNADLYREYLRRFPNGQFAVIAHARLREPTATPPQFRPEPQPSPPTQPLAQPQFPPLPPSQFPPKPQPQFRPEPHPNPPSQPLPTERAAPPQAPAPKPLIMLRPAGIGWRFVAYLIDLFIASIFGIICAATAFGPYWGSNENSPGFMIVGAWFYLWMGNSILESRRHASFGKMVTRLAVLSTDGSRLKFSRALARNSIKFVAFPLLLLWWPKRPCAHDYLAGAMVVHRPRPS